MNILLNDEKLDFNMKEILKIFSTETDFQIFLEEESGWVHRRIFETIKDGTKNRKTSVTIFKVKIEEKMSNITIESPQSEWDDNLKLCIDHFAIGEDYELCGEIVELRNLIKEQYG